MSDLEQARPGRVGKSYPADGQHSSNNQAPTAQASVTGDRFGWIVALVIAIAALIMAVTMIVSLRGITNDVENVRGLIDSSAAAASQSATAAAVAADRADRAERRAGLAEAYAKQVYVELNRLGYPVRTPIEEHEPLPKVSQ